MEQKLKRDQVKISFFLIGIIGLHFLWNGSAYISQMYRLSKFVTPEQVDIISLRYNYLFQAFGILVYTFLLWRFPKFASRKLIYTSAILIGTASVCLMLFAENPDIIIFSGIIMNFLFGLSSAYQFTLLSVIPKNRCARTFAFAYAFGTLGTYIISILDGGRFLTSQYVVIVYMALIIGNIIFYLLFKPVKPIIQKEKNINIQPSKKNIIILIVCLFIMSIINSVASEYKATVVLSGTINLALVRSFYAVGFILAGIVSDKSRESGALLCIISLIFNFLVIFLFREPSLVFIAYSLSYFVLAFYTVFRVVVFVDIAQQEQRLLPLAGLGLCIARIGEAASTYINYEMHMSGLLKIVITSALLSLLIILFIRFYAKTYIPVPALLKDEETRYCEFELKYGLSARERDVFRMVLKGHTNSEISFLLFISESTVKFHIKNILKKTQSTCRAEIINQFYKWR